MTALNRAIASAGERQGYPVFFPYVGTTFNSYEEAKEFYNIYSWEIGFGIRESRSKKNYNGYITRKDIVCSCEGFCQNPNASSARSGCKAMIRLHRTDTHGWVITSMIAAHNHPMSMTCGEKKQWGSHSFIDPITKEFIRKLRRNNIAIGRVCSIVGVLSEDSELPIRKQAVKSLCARFAQEEIQDDMIKTMALLEKMKQQDSDLEVRFKTDSDGVLEAMIWSTGKNKANYRKFGDVMTFDTTYRTNLYNLPFGIFVGDIFCAGMTSTQRSESANHMLKRFIQRSAPMHLFVSKFRDLNFDRNQEEEKENYKTKMQSRKIRMGLAIEKHAEKLYTREMHERFYKELYASGAYNIIDKSANQMRFTVVHENEVAAEDQWQFRVHLQGSDKITCSCGLYEHAGLPCKHSIKVLLHLDRKEIPRGNIHPRWLKDVSCDSIEKDDTSIAERITNQSNELKKRVLIMKALELSQTNETIDDQEHATAVRAMESMVSSMKTQQKLTSDQSPAIRAHAEPSALALEIKCPPRQKRSGRPRDTSLKSWNRHSKLEKDKKREADENTSTPSIDIPAKTRRLSDLLQVT